MPQLWKQRHQTDRFGRGRVYEVYIRSLLGGYGKLVKCTAKVVHKGDEAPMSGLNLLAEEVDKEAESDHVDKEPQEENKCLVLTNRAKPEAYVLPLEDVTDAQAGKASPTNSEDYKTPPEDALMSELHTPEAGKGKNR
ncbi:hypothetical protein Bca4012_065443 [Brassica carinata]|uniref:Uncharacterized protein n=1 Tax=Brassica carinata TaxID=52824 RepID=A0A8X7VPP5_BRACI|nr:hypothetical protein Bca52824_017777 [Brassica carinata]